MKKHLAVGTAMVLFASTGAWAADDTAKTPPAASVMAAPAAPAVPATPVVTAPVAMPTTPAPAAEAAPATSAAAPAETGKRHKWTLEDARKHAHEYADKLDKMTEEEWAQKQEKRHEWKEKWSKMTPEEKEAYKKTHHRKKAAADATPAPTPGGQ